MMFTLYSLPNIVLALLTGVLIDKIGIRKSTVLFTAMIMVGSILFSLGVFLSSFYLALLGRMFIG